VSISSFGSMATVFSNSQSSAGSTNSLIISTVRKRPRSAPPFSTSTLSDKMKFDREVDKGKRKQGPAPFPLSDPLPADATSEDDRRDAEVARQQGEETRFVRGRRAEKHLERMRDKGKDAKVMRETSRQDDERGSKRREEKAVLLSKATIDESIGTPFPLPRPSSSCSVEISPVPTRKRPTLADRNGLGETKKPSKGAAIIPRADSEKVKPKLAIKKRPPTLSRIVDPDIWASIHDSPDPLELPGPSTMVKRPPQRQPFPLAGLGSFDSMPRPLQHSPEQSSLSRYVSRDLSVFGSSPSSKSKEKKRKKGSRRDAEQRQVRRTSSDFKLGDGYSETASEDAEDLTPSAKRRNTLRIVSPDLEEDIAPVTVSRQGEGYAFFDALSQMDDDMKDGMWGSSDVELEIGASSR